MIIESCTVASNPRDSTKRVSFSTTEVKLKPTSLCLLRGERVVFRHPLTSLGAEREYEFNSVWPDCGTCLPKVIKAGSTPKRFDETSLQAVIFRSASKRVPDVMNATVPLT